MDLGGIASDIGDSVSGGAHRLGDRLSSMGSRFDDQLGEWGGKIGKEWGEWTEDPGAKLKDYGEQAIGAGMTMGLPTLLGGPMALTMNELMGSFGGTSPLPNMQTQLWGGSRARNEQWGDPLAINATRDEEQMIADQQAQIAEQKRIMDENIARTGAIYGYGSSPEAQQNAARLGDIIGSQVQGAGGAQASALSGDLQQQLQQISSLFARSGMSGSGLEQQAIRDAVGRYGAQRSGLGTSLEGLRQSLYDQLRGRSQSAQQAVARGQNVSQDAMYRDQINSLNQALSASPLSSTLNGVAGAVNTGSNALISRARGASPEMLAELMQGFQYDTASGA